MSDPQSFNLYAYCGNDPVNYVDPDGLFFKKLWKFLKKHWKAILLIAIVVAVAIIATPGAAGLLKDLFVKAGLKLGLMSKAVVGDKFVYGLTGLGKGLLGSGAAGAARSAFQSRQDQQQGEEVENDIKIGPTKGCPPGDPSPYCRNRPFSFLRPILIASGGISTSIALTKYAFNFDHPSKYKSSEGGENPYRPCDQYLGVNARFMYRYGGDGPWAQHVRQGLLNERLADPNVTMNTAHMRVYGRAFRQHPFLGSIEFPYAASAAGVGLVTQGLFTAARATTLPVSLQSAALLTSPCLPVK